MAKRPGIREDLYDVTVILVGDDDGNKCKFVFDKMTGGAITAKETKYRPANGTQDEQTLGGAVSVANITVSRLYDTDIDAWVHWIINHVGHATMYVSKQPLDANGVPFGTALNYKGQLNGCTPPATDSESDAASMIELEQSSVTPIT